MTWNYHKTLADGHRLFTKDDDQCYYIADDSGDTPDQTDDGELRFDFDRPLRIDKDGSAFIPIVGRSLVRTRTITNAAAVLDLAAMFGWAVEADEYEFNVTRTGA